MIGRMLIALAAIAASAPATAQVTLAPVFGDHTVIQRNQSIVVNGTAPSGTKLVVRLAGKNAAITADRGGSWKADFPALPAGGPYDLTVLDADGRDVASAQDVMIGDVWLCSGQSNMELPVRRALDFDTQAASFADPGLRLLTVEKATATAPQGRFAAPPSWTPASADSVPDFSAACYYMVRDLRVARGVAIGAIDATWGGTQIRAWLTPAATRTIYGQSEADLLALYTRDPLAANRAFFPRWADWWRTLSGDAAGSEPWHKPDRLSWTPFPAISYWDDWKSGDFKNFNGYVWARRSVTLTAAQAAQGATLSLGVIDDSDETFVNGKVIANTFSWSDARHYAVPAGHWRAGVNEIVVLVGDSWGNGGFQGPADALKLRFADGSEMPIGDGWSYAVATTKAGGAPRPPWDQIAGLGLIHNAMIAPLGPIRLDGIAWYQGEADVGMSRYDARLAALIDGWRGQFGRKDLAVLIVGLANFGAPVTKPSESGWALLRDEQRRAADADPRVTLVPAIDLGERLDIHPANKIELGHRLARAALGKPLPRVVDAARQGDAIVVRFDGVTGALVSWSSVQAIGFELCSDAAGSCRFASAVAEGATVRISTDGKPASRVRYGWADTPVVNLFDGANLPVGSFEVPIR
ncbi:sialate O-acetylesterase [Sphingomonas sp. LT1P40]|uniref:sialate O-acetylesterase n=1 Tax=Alteristakelama amylovorans TaxID=3096166 RepID=UPI002FCBBAF8